MPLFRLEKHQLTSISCEVDNVRCEGANIDTRPQNTHVYQHQVVVKVLRQEKLIFLDKYLILNILDDDHEQLLEQKIPVPSAEEVEKWSSKMFRLQLSSRNKVLFLNWYSSRNEILH